MVTSIDSRSCMMSLAAAVICSQVVHFVKVLQFRTFMPGKCLFQADGKYENIWGFIWLFIVERYLFKTWSRSTALSAEYLSSLASVPSEVPTSTSPFLFSSCCCSYPTAYMVVVAVGSAAVWFGTIKGASGWYGTVWAASRWYGSETTAASWCGTEAVCKMIEPYLLDSSISLLNRKHLNELCANFIFIKGKRTRRFQRLLLFFLSK